MSPPPPTPPPPAATAPAISYGSNAVSLTMGVAGKVAPPTNTGGAAVNWSISPALPAGLALDMTTGAIGGTPDATAAPETYMVTAQNSAGQSTTTLTLSVLKVLLDLGHSQTITALRLTSSRVLSLDQSSYWVLWDYAAAAKLASGSALCGSSECVAGKLSAVDMEGPTMADETTAGLEVRSSADGSLLGTISASLAWWRLATDGSYVCGGNASGLTVWSLSGMVTSSRAGDYSKAVAFASPGQIQVAVGPAGANMIEMVSVPSGSSSVSPTFQGTFHSWFLDGQRFLTNTGNTVFTYSSGALQQDVTALNTVDGLTGEGNWFWVYPATTVTIYKVGASGTPAASYDVGVEITPVGSGSTLGLIPVIGAQTVSVIDLSGPTPLKADHATPSTRFSAYAATSASQWTVGNLWGVLLDGASVGGTARYFGYGTAWSIAGSTQRVAVSTAVGKILYFNAATQEQEGSLDYPSSQIAMSADGAVLAVTGDQNDGPDLVAPDQSIHIYSLPAGTLLHIWPYTFVYPFVPGELLPGEISLSASGTILGQVLSNPTVTPPDTRQVNAATGGPVLWSDTIPITDNPSVGGPLPVRLSPDGTEIAVSDTQSELSTTNIYNNGTLVTAVPGWAVGWLDNSRLLVNTYTRPPFIGLTYQGSSIYSASGSVLASPPLPEIWSFDVVSSDSIYDPGSGALAPGGNAIYSLTTGQPIWTSSLPFIRRVGAIAGANVVFVSGSQVVAEPY